MASGLIGTSRIVADGTVTTTGTTLSYTVPSSGVSYAVVSVNAACTSTSTDANAVSYARAGTCVTNTRNAALSVSSATAYSVILIAGQTWSDFAEASGSHGYCRNMAFLQASVLEVV